LMGQTREATVRRLKAAADGGGGFCEDAFGQAYFLKRTDDLHEGQKLQVEIVGEPRPPKPAWVRPFAGPARPAALKYALEAFGIKGPMEVMALALLKEARAALPHDDLVLGAYDTALAERAAEILEVQEMEQEGTRIRWDPTATAHLIDVDGVGRTTDINRQAAHMAADLIVSRNLGGLILIDFLAPARKQERRDIQELLAGLLSSTPHGLHIHVMNASGHIIAERQHLGPPFVEAFYD